MAKDPEVKVKFLGDSKDLAKSIDDVDDKMGKFKQSAGSVAAGILASDGLKRAITDVTDGLKNCVNAFLEDDKASASLAKTLENTVGATKAQVDATEKFINKTQNATGVLDDQLRPALETLLRGTGDLTKAQKLLGLAMDISAGTGKDLGSVTDALSKAANGNFKALKALDPALNDLIKDGASTDEIMSALADTFKGQTAVAADTAAGKMAIAKARFTDFQEQVGEKLVPALAVLADIVTTKVIPAIEKISKFVSDNIEYIAAAALGIAVALVPAFIAWAIAAASAAAATLVAAAPVIAIGVAVAALAAGIIYAYTHWGWFKAAVDAVGDALVWVGKHFDDVLNVVKSVIDWITEHWALLLTVLLGPFGLAVAEIIKHFDTIKEAFADVYGFFVTIADKLYNAIKGPFEEAFRFVKEVYDHSIGPIIDAISNFGPGSHGNIEDVKKVMGRAGGGPVMGGMPYLVGERGPELFVPGSSGSIAPNGGGGTQVINLVVDGRVLASAVVNASNDAGGLPIRIRAAS